MILPTFLQNTHTVNNTPNIPHFFRSVFFVHHELLLCVTCVRLKTSFRPQRSVFTRSSRLEWYSHKQTLWIWATWTKRQDFRWIMGMEPSRLNLNHQKVKSYNNPNDPKVKYEVRETPLGKGVFVLESVKQGSLIWRWCKDTLYVEQDYKL